MAYEYFITCVAAVNGFLEDFLFDEEVSMSFVLSVFREVNDPRDMNARHNLAELLFLALAATLCGSKSCVEIADFADGREEELREFLDLKHGLPSHDTFSRVFRLLEIIGGGAGTFGLKPPTRAIVAFVKASRFSFTP